MWNRLVRVVRSFVGMFISVAENPEIILEQNIRDMNDQVPRMNESIAMVKANVTLLEKEESKYKTEISELTSKVKAAIQGGRDDLAASFATRLETVRSAHSRTSAQLQTAQMAYDKALNVKKAFLREKERKTQEAMQAIRDHRRSQWQKKVADVLDQFEVAGVSQTHDEMVRKIEEDAEELRAAELVKQFKVEMGLMSPAPAASTPDKTIGGREGERTGA